MADTKRGIEQLGDALRNVNVDSRTYWFGELPEEITTEPSPTAHLLQAYDEYSNGYGESRDLFNPYVDRIMARRGAIHMVVINGTIAGAWKRTLRAKALRLRSSRSGT